MTQVNEKKWVIFGCGYVGTALARRVQGMGHAVTALTRNAATAAELERSGVGTFVSDLASDDWHRRVAGEFDVIVVCVGSGRPDVEGYRNSYVDGIRSVQRWMATASHLPATGVFTSSTSVYPQGDGERIDEQADTSTSVGTARVLIDAEDRWHATPLARRVVLRLAGIYGPGRHHLLDELRAGATEMRGGTQRLNLAHRDDIVTAILACVERQGLSGALTFNVADGAPASREDVIAWLAGRLGRTVPAFAAPRRRDGEPVRDRVIVSDALRKSTDWRPAFGDYLAGYEDILRGG